MVEFSVALMLPKSNAGVREKHRRLNSITTRVIILCTIISSAGVVFGYILHNVDLFVLLSGTGLGLLLGEAGIGYWDREEARRRHEDLQGQLKRMNKAGHLLKFKNASELAHCLYRLVGISKEDEFPSRLLTEKALAAAQPLGISDAVGRELRYFKPDQAGQDVNMSRGIIQERTTNNPINFLQNASLYA